jgi:hypothetical protein
VSSPLCDFHLADNLVLPLRKYLFPKFSINTPGKGNIVWRTLFNRYMIIAESPKAQRFRTDLEKEAGKEQKTKILKVNRSKQQEENVRSADRPD